MPAPDNVAQTLDLAGVFGQLETILAAEFAALRSRDVAALETACTAKAALVTQLEALAAQVARLDRAAVMRELGPLRARARACVEANRINGGAIELNRTLTGRLLDLLRGMPHGAPLYDAGGRLERRPGVRQVGYA